MLYPTELRVQSGVGMDEGLGGESQESVLGGEDDVFELDLHWRACVHLEGDDTGFWGFCGFVGDIGGKFAVDVLLDAISLSDNFVFVPIVFVDGGLHFLGVPCGAGDFDFGFFWLFTLFENDLLAALGKDTTTFFFVENAAVYISVFEIRLVTAHDEFCGVNDFAAVLDAAVGVFFVVTRSHFILQGEGEIRGFASFPDNEGVVWDGIFRGGFSGDSAIDNGPELCIAFPTGEVFAVEDLGFSSKGWEGEDCE
jgi:hypothetical protein